MTSLKDMIGKEKWQILSKKYSHLDDLLYLVKCDTCSQVFWETKVATAQEMLKSGEWDPHLPLLWYVTAGRHWIEAKFHAIRVTIHDDKGDSTLVKDLSAEWTAGYKQMKLTDQKMLSELADLERKIVARTNK